MKKKDFVFNLNEEIVKISAFSKLEAFMVARLMGYKKDIKDIREY